MRGRYAVADLPKHKQSIPQWPVAQVQALQIPGLTEFRNQKEPGVAGVIVD